MALVKLVVLGIAIAVLCQFEVKETKWAASKSVTLKASVDEAFNFITNVKNCEKWFPYVSRIEEADSRPFGVGKKLHPVLKIPVYGEHKAECTITEYQKLKRIVLEPSCIFRPQLELDFASVAKHESKVTITVKYKRLSYFFQYTFAPALHYWENYKIEQALTSLALQFPQRASKPKANTKASTQEDTPKATAQKAKAKASTEKATPKASTKKP